MLLLWLALYMQSVIDVLLIRNQTNLVLQYFVISFVASLQCFDAVGWAAGRASGL